MVESQLYVAPWGRDSWPGTFERPFATLPAAQRAVRARTASLSADLVVSLRAGTYVLTEPFVLSGDEGDSGENGYRVVYQAYGHGTADREEAVISGGRRITGWRPTERPGGRGGGQGGSWRAEVGDLETRQLYVDGRRAARAAISPGIPGTVTKTETGYVTDSTVPQSWQDPASIEFVYPGVYPWSEARCQVAGITGDERSSTITLAQPGFGRARELYNAEWVGESPPAESGTGVWQTMGMPSSAENSASFLTEPGTFALDRTTPGRHVLHYRPLPGEDPAQAEIVAPVLEELVVGRGSEDHPLHDVTLRGLVFADAGWTKPSGPGGFLHFHGNSYYDGGPLQKVELAEGMARLAVPVSPEQLPANVRFEGAVRITLEGNTFTRLGAGALALLGPGRDNAVLGNVIEDVSGSGLAVESGTGTRVEHNLIRRIGREYHGTPAVWVVDTREATVAHNEIHDVPYCGIIVVGGDRAARVQIVENLIHHTMTVLADGGGIYLNGRQGSSYASGTLVRGNVIRDTVTSYNFGLYTDYGAAWVTVQGNVVHRGDTPIVLRVTPPLENVAFLGNFWDDQPEGHDSPPAGVVLAGNTVLPKDDFERALAADPAGADILASAGRGVRG
ncbi:right-handed parallel beta-helix repeat-containing protein [Kitasatospora sp. NPDC056138]|uniref:right-handed parallel beta-helix repeat-containing protein n=1 Tax=Kitasatospora sp. NPDC056138 TaxID=3345724 RepID=UPI0035DE3F62